MQSARCNLKTLFKILFLISTFSASAFEFTVKKDGKILKKIPLEELKSIKDIETIQSHVYNPWRDHEKNYIGYNFYKFLDFAYGKEWRKGKKIHFKALDGYQQISNIKEMLRLSNNTYSPILAYREKDHKSFRTFNNKNKTVDPGPVYLLWSGFKKVDKVSHGDVLKWPYQLKEINVTTK